MKRIPRVLDPDVRRWASWLLLLAMSGTVAGTGVALADVPAKKDREAPPARCRPQATVVSLPHATSPDWFGLYLLDKKAGWLQSSVRIEDRGGKKVLVARQTMVVEVNVGQRAVRREQTETKVFEAKPGGRILSASSVRKGDGGERSLNVDCRGSTCKAIITAEDGTQTREIPRPPELAEQADAARLAAATCSTIRGHQLASEDLRTKGMTDRYVGRTTIGRSGVAIPVSVVEELEEGDRVAARILVGDDGKILEIRYGEALVGRPEPEDVARRVDVVDLFNLARVPLPRALPRDVPMTITYGFRGIPKAFQVDDARQRYSSGTPGETLLTVTANRPKVEGGTDVPRGPANPNGDEDQRSTPEIDWEHPEIRKLADRVVGSTSGTWAASRKLTHAVYERLEKVYGQSRDRASEILRASKGDCTEHTRLFVALARAAGIRAREVKGLVFASYGEGGPGLYWHAWPEVKVGTEWIAVDPTFDQEVADATHIALARGTQVDAAALLGALQVTRADPKPR